jgi:hypothetical protein
MSITDTINETIKTHFSVFITYTILMTLWFIYYMIDLTVDIAQCENNPSKFCPKFYGNSNPVLPNTNST